MKILYIASIDFYAKPNPSFHLMSSMIKDLLDNDIEVDFIGCQEKGIDKHIPDELKNDERFTFQLIETVPVKKSSFVKRYLTGIQYSRRVAKILKKKVKNADVVFVQSSPTVLYTLRYARRYAKEKKIVYNVQDMFPGSSIASGVMPNKLMQKIFYRLQKIAYKKADVITAISEDMKYKLMEQGVAEEKIEVIVNWFDDRTVHQVDWDKNRFVQKYSLTKDKFYVQYAGTMGYVFDYKMVIAIAEQLQEQTDIIIQMIGAGSQKESFMKEVKEKDLRNIIFYPLENQDMVSDVYSACSVCFIPLKKGIIGNSVPSKAGLLMACHKPIITTVDKGSDYAAMINENAGIAVSNDEPQKAVEAILQLYRDVEKCEYFGEKGFAYGKDLYSRKNNMERYIALFRRLA